MPRNARIRFLLLLAQRARHRWRPAAWVFGVCVAVTLALAVLLPSTYQSTMKVSVGNVTDAAVDPRLGVDAALAEDPLSRDIQQLTNEDILRQVVLQSHLAKAAAPSDPDAFRRQEEAVRRLQNDLSVAAFQGPEIIELTYRSTSADRAADVLRNLAGAYANTYRVLPAAPPSSARLGRMSESNRVRLDAALAELARFNRARRTDTAPVSLDEADLRLTQAQAAARRALLRRVADLRTLDQNFRAQIQEARLVERIDAQNISALGTMEPSAPRLVNAPPRALIAIFGLLASLLLAAATAVGLELLSDRLHTRTSVEQAIGVPVLASIPANAVAPAFQDAFPALYLAMQRPATAFEGKLS